MKNLLYFLMLLSCYSYAAQRELKKASDKQFPHSFRPHDAFFRLHLGEINKTQKWAARKQSIQKLITQNYDPNTIIFSQPPKTALCAAVERSDNCLVDDLFLYGANLARGERTYTDPLLFKAKTILVAQSLLKHNASVEDRLRNQKTVLHQAALIGYSPDLIHLYKAEGVKPTALDGSGKSPLDELIAHLSTYIKPKANQTIYLQKAQAYLRIGVPGDGLKQSIDAHLKREPGSECVSLLKKLSTLAAQEQAILRQAALLEQEDIDSVPERAFSSASFFESEGIVRPLSPTPQPVPQSAGQPKERVDSDPDSDDSLRSLQEVSLAPTAPRIAEPSIADTESSAASSARYQCGHCPMQ